MAIKEPSSHHHSYASKEPFAEPSAEPFAEPLAEPVDVRTGKHENQPRVDINSALNE